MGLSVREVVLQQSGKVNSLLRVLCLELAVWAAGCLHAASALEGSHWKPFALARQLQVECIRFSICFIVSMH